ncbi:phosphate acetyltransferase [Streptosporangium becharense]|uniref:Phosphate acetyltransferase n=1 Tax=Streptosporangium becharense TaxID=1816182 RepID=A0A7W9IIV5_9ACTN|nr:phosphate acetyltransferase [Streptosporangium becharense]MBB2911404.1 phosphate acetyltransferase [Streptosporangium becharense]MBB5821538.1 phosphate acetyltransferase [Streptosporangium becharense]
MRSIYVAGLGRGDGRQIVELGLMELLTRRVDRTGVFRPITGAGEDRTLELLKARYRPAASATGVSAEDAAEIYAELGAEELISRLVARFHTLERECDALLVLGSSFDTDDLPRELAFNARLAAEFGAPVIVVVGAHGDSAEEIVTEMRTGYQVFSDLGCTVLAVIANRVPGEVAIECDLPVPCYAIPENPSLSAPTVGQVMQAVDAELLQGDEDGLRRDVLGFVFGGATLPVFLEHLVDGALVITPGDRSDLLLVSLAAEAAGTARPSGVVMTVGEEPPDAVRALTARLAPGVPVLTAEADSFTVATTLAGLEGRLTPDNPRKIETALGHFETHVDTEGLADRIELARSERVTPMMFEHTLLERARASLRHIVLPEGEEDRILRAADVLLRRGIVDLTLLGREEVIRRRIGDLGLDLGEVTVVDPLVSPLRESFAQEYAGLRAHKGMTMERAMDVVTDVNFFGTMMLHRGLVHGMVSGAAHTTAATILPAFQIIKTVPDTSIVSSVFFMCLSDRVLVYGDCAVNPVPDAEQLADIAISSARTAKRFGVEPRVAMLSYSTGESGSGADVDKVRAATALVAERAPDLLVEGPIQYDAAVDPRVAAAKLPGSQVAGRATVLIFPDLNTGNNTYKAVQRSAGAVAVGPVLQGLRRPVNDLSRGALVTDIVSTVAITAIQAQEVAP